MVHRDYSFSGKDIKIAVYDDMVEVTSPGLLPPSIDYSAMESRQSDAKNKVIAPVFKKLGIIDQWGNGLKLIADELKNYPDIVFQWKEVGLSFQVQFINRMYSAKIEAQKNMGHELGHELGQDLGHELGQEQQEKTLFSQLLEELNKQSGSKRDLMVVLEMKTASGYFNRTIKRLQTLELIALTIPYIPNHPQQKFQITEKGKTFLKLLND